MHDETTMEVNECPVEPHACVETAPEIALRDFLSVLNRFRPALLTHFAAGVRGDWRQRLARHQAAVGLQLDLISQVASVRYLDDCAADVRTFEAPLSELATPDTAHELLDAAGVLATQLLNAHPRSARLALAQALCRPDVEPTLSVYEGCGAVVVDLVVLAPQTHVLVGRIFLSEPVSETCH